MSVHARLVASPCCTPELPLEPALRAYAELGFGKFEVFVEWARSAIDYGADVATCRALTEKYGLIFSSMHLPTLRDPAAVAEAVRAIEFAAALDVPIVLYKAANRSLYSECAAEVLATAEHCGVTAVLQNHFGSAVQTLADVQEVLDDINDPRLRVLLEVGQFHSAGVDWRTAEAALRGRIALVHLKDQIGRQSVPFGTGEIDLPAFFAHMRAVGYAGDYVLEMEVTDTENTLRYVAEAAAYVEPLLEAV